MGFQIENGALIRYTEEPGVTDVVIPEGVTCIGDSAFSRCQLLTNITIPESVTRIGDWAFEYCESLTSITIPEGVTRIGIGVFIGCCLTSITIPESVTSIGTGAFASCKSLTSITIPEGVTSIEDETFEDCLLRGITIPKGVTSIGEKAFKNCWLTSITIPEGVTHIGGNAFSRCECLTSFTCSSAIAKDLSRILPEMEQFITFHIDDITNVGTKFRPGAVVGFAEDGRSCTDENGKKYCKYIRSNAAKLIPAAMEHPALLHLMIREKLITAKDLEAVTAAVQESGNAEWIAAMLEYGHSSVSEKDKEKVRRKQDERETNVTNFVFDAEKLEALQGKTFVVTGKLKTFVSRDELKECLAACGAVLTETLARGVDYLITNTPDSGTAKNKKAVELGIARITEAQFNEMIGRKVQE